MDDVEIVGESVILKKQEKGPKDASQGPAPPSPAPYGSPYRTKDTNKMIYTTTNREGLYDFPEWERPTGGLDSIEWEPAIRTELPIPAQRMTIPPQTPPRNFVDPKYSLYQTKFNAPSQRFYDQRERINEIRERLGRSYLPFFQPDDVMESEQCHAWRRCIEIKRRNTPLVLSRTPSTSSHAPSRALLAASASAPALINNNGGHHPTDLKSTHAPPRGPPAARTLPNVVENKKAPNGMEPESRESTPLPSPQAKAQMLRTDLEAWVKREKEREARHWAKQVSRAKRMQQTLYAQRFAQQYETQMGLELRRQMLQKERAELLRQQQQAAGPGGKATLWNTPADHCFHRIHAAGVKQEADKLKQKEREVRRAIFDMGVSEEEWRKQEKQCVNSLMDDIGKMIKRRRHQLGVTQ